MAGGGWIARLGRSARAGGSVVLWGIVVLLVGAVAVGDRSVGAQKVEPTDTTAATGGDGSGEGSEWASTRPHCEYGDCNGVCRYCQRRTYWHDGDDCVPVDPDPTCPGPDEARVCSWPGRCVPIECPLRPGSALGEWRNSRTGECTSPPPPPPPPTSATTSVSSVIPDSTDQMIANGDSRAVSGDGGQIIVTWDRVSNATSYELRHMPGTCTPRGCSSSSTYTFTDSDDEDTDDTDTITLTLPRPLLLNLRLAVETSYTIEVEAINSSGRSRPAVGYAYTTQDPFPRHTDDVRIEDLEEIGIIQIAGHRASVLGSFPVYGYYGYRICTDTLSSDTDEAEEQKKQINEAVRTWREATGLVTFSYSEEDCTGLSAYPSWIQLVHEDDMDLPCQPDSDGCIRHYPNPLTTPYGRLTTSQIFIRSNASTAAQSSLDGMCSRLFQIAMHEAGHAYGLHHTTRLGSEAVMGDYTVHCEPQAYDVVAVMVIYQSR